MQVYFVGAGPGDPELLTVKAARLISTAPVIIYAGSLIPRSVLDGARADAALHDSAALDLLAIMQDGEIFDGEIYIHGLPLQTIVSYVKKLRPESKLLKYYVYDIGDATKTFEKRYATYSSVIPENDKIIAVQCVTINSPDDIQFAHDGFVEEGYEGLILRNKLGLYQFNLIRSKDLIKFKRFEDKEFTIIGGKTAVTGRYEGGCVFRCRCENGEEFDVAPRGSMERRRKYYQDLPKLINKELTVRFIGRSLAGIPQHVVGIVVRDYE